MIFLSKDPKVFLVENFFSKKECFELIEKNYENLTDTKVTDGHKVKKSNLRTGKYTFLKEDKSEYHLIKKICKLHDWSIKNVEKPQMINYRQGNWYAPHYDAFDEYILKEKEEIKGQRLFTNIIYLNENFTGGETVFPKLNLSIKPKIGMLLSFQNCFNGTNFLNPFMQHSSSPIKKGEKNIISVWLTSR